MKKRIWMALFLTMGFCFFCGSRAEAAVNPDGSVTINEENFPDKWFREGIKCCDENQDGVLSEKERNGIAQIKIKAGKPEPSMNENFYSYKWACDLEIDRPYGPLSIDGICYFENVTDLFINGYEYVTGSVKENKKLKTLGLCGTGGKNMYAYTAEMEKMFSLQRLKYLFVQGLSFDNFALKEAVNLTQLHIECGDLAWKTEVQKFDLSYQKKLRTITLHNVAVGTLDLRQNKELARVCITAGEKTPSENLYFYKSEVDKPSGIPYYNQCLDKCTLLLPSQNKIKNIQYFAKGSELDITQCKKLRSVHIGEGVKVKMLRQWYKKFGRQNLCFIVNGDVGKKFKVPGKGKYMHVKGKKN